MTIVHRPTAPSMLGGSISSPAACLHEAARPSRRGPASPGTVGTVAVVGAGKMGLPLAPSSPHGWSRHRHRHRPDVVDAINDGRSHVDDEPGLAELVAPTHDAGRSAPPSTARPPRAEADVVVLIVPVMLDDEQRPDYRYMDAAVDSIAPGVHAGSTVIFETTLPVGDTRHRFAPRLEEATGLVSEEDLFVAFSPERLFTARSSATSPTYPKLVGGLGEASTARAAAFYATVLDAEVVAMLAPRPPSSASSPTPRTGT